MFEKVRQGIKGFRRNLAWHRLHGPRAPKAGEAAPDFELSDVKGENAVRLSQFRGQRPVALVFGSFT
jgi:hypothetical protein